MDDELEQINKLLADTERDRDYWKERAGQLETIIQDAAYLTAKLK